jgi:hypothetical protein
MCISQQSHEIGAIIILFFLKTGKLRYIVLYNLLKIIQQVSEKTA